MKTITLASSLIILFFACQEDNHTPSPSLINLSIRVQHDTTFDSAYVAFSNADTIRKQRLIVEPGTLMASGLVRGLQTGDWEVSVSFFNTAVADVQSNLRKTNTTVSLRTTSIDLYSSPATISVHDSQLPNVDRPIMFENYSVFYFYRDTKQNAIITLPDDPLNPFFGLEILNPDWQYFYTDRTFYHQRPGEPDSHYLQGSGALERTNTGKIAVDFQDNFAFKKTTDSVAEKTWNIADAVVNVTIDDKDQPLFYYVWDLTGGSNGRKAFNKSSDAGKNKPSASLKRTTEGN